VPAIAATVVLLRSVLGLLMWGVVAGLTWTVPQYRDSFGLAALYGLSILTAAVSLGWLAQARGHSQVVGLAMLGTHVGYFGGVQLAVFFGWPAVSVPIALVISETLTAAALWLRTVRTIGPVTRTLPVAQALSFLR